MSRRTPNVDCGASQRNFIFVIFALGSFSTAAGVLASLRFLFAKISADEWSREEAQ